MYLNEDGLIETGPDRVRLKPYIARPLKNYELMTDQELEAGAGGTLFVDTETYKNFNLIAFKDHKTKKVIQLITDVENGIYFNERKLSWIMHNYRTVGFNSKRYDLLIIWFAYTLQQPEMIKRVSDAIILQNMFHLEVQREFNFKIFPTNHIDLIEVCPLKGGLKLYAARLHAKRIQDLPFDISLPLTEEQKIILTDYNVNDLDETELIFDNLPEQLALRESMSNEYRQDLMSKSDAQIAEAVIGSELQRLNGGKWPSKPKLEGGAIFNYDRPNFIFFQTPQMQKIADVVSQVEYQVLENGRVVVPKEIESLDIRIGDNVYRMGSGGLHSSEKCIAVKSDDEYILKDRDVASYYPSIILNCKLYPEHLGEDFLNVYNGIVERRLAAKKAKNISVSENLKVTINGSFGKLGSPYSILYSPKLLIQVTVTGQLGLLMLIEKLEMSGIPVYSANTDGIVIKCPRNKEAEYLEIISMWEKITGFVTEETTYSAIYSRDVNAYMAVKEAKDGKPAEVKGKNVYYDPWTGKTAKDAYWRFQKNPTAQIAVEAVEKLITQNIPIEDTIKASKDITRFVCVKNVTGGAHKDGNYLGRTIRWYYAIGIVGTINYIKNNNTVPDSEGAKPCMDLPDEFPTDIDYGWYIRRAKDLLEDMAYIKKPRQIKFF